MMFLCRWKWLLICVWKCVISVCWLGVLGLLGEVVVVLVFDD